MQDHIKISFFESLTILRDFCSNEDHLKTTAQCVALIAECFQRNNKVIIAGNGGSACDAMHFAEEFTGKFRDDRKPLPVIGLTDPAHITACANDFGFEFVFARSIEAFGQKGDIFIGLSTSGNSPNIIKAMESSQKKGLKTIALLGRDGGKLLGQADYEFIVPAKTSDRAQEVHMTILHIIIEGVERQLFPENYK
jgi:D-sedoheptulose 7-phosphate isomerase